jgi:uncharacterized protein DUF4279
MEDPAYFYEYNASLRIAGVGHLHGAITERTGISPTHIAFAGDRPFRSSDRLLVEDLWMLDSPLDRASHWDFHLRWLWEQVGPHAEYFRFVIGQAAWADVCLGCLSSCAWPVLEAHRSGLDIVRELPVSVSFNFTSTVDA